MTVAAGFDNGRVCLISYSEEGSGQFNNTVLSGTIVKEFNYRGTLKSKRKCNSLAWSKNDPNLLAVGYGWAERKNTANQHSIVVWDVNKEGKVHGAEYPLFAPYMNEQNFSSNLLNLALNTDKGMTKRSKIQVIKDEKYIFDKRDDSSALIWLNDDNSKLISGSSKGILKLFDLQGSSPIEVNAHRYRINSIKLSPFNPYIFASC